MSEGQAERPNYGGMTVNERLFVAGTLDQWEAAARLRDRATMISLLMQVDMTEESAAWSVDTMLSNPARYGF